MAQRVDTRTIHTITIDLQDDVLAGIQPSDEGEIILVHRGSQTTRKKLTYRDIDTLTTDSETRLLRHTKARRVG